MHDLACLERGFSLNGRLDISQARHDLRDLLDGAEGGSIAARKHDCRDDGRLPQPGREDGGDAGALERARALSLGPNRALREKRPNDNQRQRRD